MIMFIFLTPPCKKVLFVIGGENMPKVVSRENYDKYNWIETGEELSDYLDSDKAKDIPEDVKEDLRELNKRR